MSKYRYELSRSSFTIFIRCQCASQLIAEIYLGQMTQKLIILNVSCRFNSCTFIYDAEESELWEGIVKLGGIPSLFEYFKDIK